MKKKGSRKKLTSSQLAKRIEEKEWSPLIKLLAGNKCELCGSRETLNSHHLERKQSNYLRTLLDNGICLCVKCHMDGIHSAEFEKVKKTVEAIEKYKGREHMEKLLAFKNNPPKMTVPELQELRKNYKEQIKTYEH